MVTPARFFTWLQDAAFYVDLHRAAVALVPASGGRWIDVGCGPGLVARLAADVGFDAIGIDRDPRMIAAARRRAGLATSPRFEVGDVAGLGREVAEVVSATSLFATVPDPAGALRALWGAVRPGGTLLVVETTATMTPAHVRAVAGTVPARRRRGLMLWAVARNGRAFDAALFERVPGAVATTGLLLDGLVAATTLTRPV